MVNVKFIAIGALMTLAVSQGSRAENIILTTPQNFQVVGLSPNGKWACGVFVGGGETSASFRWNLETGKVEMIGANDESIAWGVADDGTVSGNYACTDLLRYGNPIQTAAIARGTRWEALEIPEGTDRASEGFGYSITADGRSVSGTVYMGGVLTPVIWRDGKVYKVFSTPKHSMAYCISPDGEAVAGWTYGPKYSNRAATYWAPDGTINMLLDSPQWSETMFNSAKAFSPDGKTLLYWGGWDPVSDENGNYIENHLYALYDIETGERHKIKTPAVSSTMEFYAMTNSGLLVGTDMERGYVYKDGQGMYIDDYLQSRGVDITKYADFYSGDGTGDYMPIFRIQNVTDDANTFIFIFYDSEGVLRSMCLKIDQDLTAVPPVGLTAERMAGLNTVALSWMAPLEAKGIRGYNIYRDGRKLNGLLPLNRLYYYDSNLTEGTYTYRVAAVNAAGTETFAPDVDVEVSGDAVAAPMALFARQKGVSDAYLTWAAPESNKTHLRYFDPESKAVEPMSVYQPVEMEVAVKYDRNNLAQYAGAKVSEVSFMPMGGQDAWTIVFYTADSDGNLTELVSQPVTGSLRYRELNTVRLDTPLALPDADLIMALRVMVSSDQAAVIGSDNSFSAPGYSDLLRQTSEAGFYSAFDSSTASAQSVSYGSWALDMVLQQPDYDAAADVVDHYNVYLDGSKVAETAATEALLAALADGTHKVAVEAMYAGGRCSAAMESEVVVAGNYEGVDAVSVEVSDNGGRSTVDASWEAPLNCDRLTLSYDPADVPSRGIKGVNNSLIAGADYVASMLRGYEGYRVESVAFYPLCDAIFTIGIYEDGILIHEQEVYDFTPGAWCTVKLDNEVIIKANSDYRLTVDAFDSEPGMSIFGVGSEIAFPYRSDLYSTDGGSTYSSLWIETGSNTGWLMRFNIAEVDGVTLEPEGYDVMVDGKVANSQRLAEPHCSIDMGEGAAGQHSIVVNTYYTSRADAVKGAVNTFRIVAAGIDGNVIATVDLHQSATQLVAEGEGVESMALFNIAGLKVASAHGNILDIAELPEGVYVVHIGAGQASLTRKIHITK